MVLSGHQKQIVAARFLNVLNGILLNKNPEYKLKKQEKCLHKQI
jgi:hypothetical protein